MMFKCPSCDGDAESLKVKNRQDEVGTVGRRRRCRRCGYKFRTLEAVAENSVKVAVPSPSAAAFVLSAWQADLRNDVPRGWRARVESFCCDGMRQAWAADLVHFGNDWDAVCQRMPAIHIFDFDWEYGWPEPVRLPGHPVHFCPWCGAHVVIRTEE